MRLTHALHPQDHLRPTHAPHALSHYARPAPRRFGPTRFSVIPKTAVGKVSVRFVPHQDPNTIIASLQQHVQAEFARLGSSNTIRCVPGPLALLPAPPLPSLLEGVRAVCVQEAREVLPLASAPP